MRMEQNPPKLAKKAWNLLHLMFFMLKKTISKARFITDLNMMMKRGKIAGKTLHKVLFHLHHHHHHAATTVHLPFPTPPPSDDDEDEFSCTTTPQHQNHIDPVVINKAVEMLTRVSASPEFGKSPVVRQLRITDSPFPLNNGDNDGQVDEDAEKFILRFYNGLKMES